ncbi:MAG: hypothetical protein ABSG57_12970 [Candidatus Bathyarchaeia archaeon]
MVKATPNWSVHLKRYTVCTAGISENNEWRRLYPMEWSTIRDKGIKVWDKIKVSTSKPEKDPRPESRKIDNESVENCGCAIKDREERREFLNAYTDTLIPDATKTKKTLSIIKPILFGFSVEKENERGKQVTIDGDIFKVQPYGDISLTYQFKCGEKGCAICSRVHKFHHMECFDFGANELYRKYQDEKVAKEKVREGCYTRMKADNDCWFAMGTHSQYPFLKWMVVGLLWMKKAS